MWNRFATEEPNASVVTMKGNEDNRFLQTLGIFILH
jgi:hypothetical protein